MIAEKVLLMRRPLLTVQQIAKILNTEPYNVNRWLRDGLLPGIKVGREWRVEPDDFEEFLRKNKRPPKDESQNA